jgi:hypothetical protein
MEKRPARRPPDDGSGFGLRATRNGALILETENARLMMRRLRKLRHAPTAARLLVMERKESDQLPEEGPPEQVPDDESGGAREEAEDTPGVPGEEERGTGHDQ